MHTVVNNQPFCRMGQRWVRWPAFFALIFLAASQLVYGQGQMKKKAGKQPSASASSTADPAAAAPPDASADGCPNQEQLFSDCDVQPLDLSAVGGYEAGFQSAEESASNPFLAIYGRYLFTHSKDAVSHTKPNTRGFDYGPYFAIRLLQSPTAGGTNNVFSVLNNPTQTITTDTLSQVGSAADVTLGLDFHPRRLTNSTGRTTGDIIIGGGFVSPTEANSQQAAFQMPNYGTEECSQMQNLNLKASVAAVNATTGNQYQWATSANSATNPSCLLNNLAINNGSPTGINTLIYASPDHASFYGKYSVGFRLINRYYTQSGQKGCTAAQGNTAGNPCSRGILDVTLGQNASITGGKLRGLVFGAEAIHPMPTAELSFIYVFGAIFKRIDGAPSPALPPLILQPATISAGINQPPNPATLVLPAQISNRDFYRFGAGVSITQIYSALKSAKQPPQPSPAAPSPAPSVQPAPVAAPDTN
jgi:hypothetical protein